MKNYCNQFAAWKVYYKNLSLLFEVCISKHTDLQLYRIILAARVWKDTAKCAIALHFERICAPSKNDKTISSLTKIKLAGNLSSE